jgi:hypothetical protein
MVNLEPPYSNMISKTDLITLSLVYCNITLEKSNSLYDHDEEDGNYNLVKLNNLKKKCVQNAILPYYIQCTFI